MTESNEGQQSEVQGEIGAMIDSLGGESHEEPVIEAKIEGVEVKEEVKEPLPAKEEPVKGDEGVEVKEPEKVVVKEEVKLEDKDQTIADLRTKLAESLAAKETKKEEIKEPIVEAKKEEFKFEEQDFVGDLDLDDLTNDPKEFNKLLNKIYVKAATDARKGMEEGVLRTIPDIVRNSVTVMNELQSLSDKFYADNEDLKPFKKVVATVFEEIAAADPGKKYHEYVDKVGPEVRKRLDLHKKTTTEIKKGESPRLPTKGAKAGSIKEKPSIAPLQSELEEMNKTLGRY